jgi:hypothetical protein
MWDWDDLGTDPFLQAFDVEARVRAREWQPGGVATTRSVPPKLGAAKVWRPGNDHKMRVMANRGQAKAVRRRGEPDVQ